MKRVLALTPLTLIALAAPAHAGGGCHTATPSEVVATATITMGHSCFEQEAVRVAVGATVTWENASGSAHNLSGPAIEFAEMPHGAKHAKTFGEPGLYPFACTIHAGMSGVVLVGADAGLPPVTAPAVQPVASAGDGGGTPYAPWAVGGVAALAVIAGVATFTRRNAGVPVTAR